MYIINKILFFGVTTFLLMAVLQIHAQTIGDYRSKISGNWNVAATWETWNGTSWIVSGTPSSANQNITIQNGHIVTITANVTIDQTTILAGGKVILSAGTLTIANGTGTDFIIAGIYERTSISTSITISAGANISCSSGGLYTHKVAGGSVPTITWDNGSVLRLDSSALSNLNQSFWNVEVTGGNASSLSTDNTSRTMTIRNDFKLQGGNFYLKNGGLSGGTHVIRVQGQYLESGGSFNWNSSSSDNTSVLKIEVEKDLIVSGGAWSGFVSSTDCNSGVYFLGTGEQTYSTILEHNATGAVRNRFYYKTTGGPTALHEIYNGSIAQFSINGTCGTIVGFSPWPTSGSLLQTFTINNTSGVTLRDNRTINDTLYRTKGSITLSSSTITYASNAALAYNGTVAINTENAEFPLSNGPKHLIINNNSGVTLHSDRTIAGNLHFQNGLLNTGSCISATNNTMLVLASGSSVTGANNNRYVNGILRKIGNTAFTFPIGIMVSMHQSVFLHLLILVTILQLVI